MEQVKFQLGQFVRMGLQNNILFCGFGSLQKEVRDVELQKIISRLSNLWRHPSTISEMRSMAEKQGFHKAAVEQALAFLLDNGFVHQIDQISPSRHNRSHLYYQLSGGNPLDIQGRLARSRVAILGCGGIGNVVGVNLATMGIGTLVLVDDDRVELTNLTRQILFTQNDVEALKSEVLKRELKKRNSEVEIHSFSEQISSEAQLHHIVTQAGGVDLFILSADGGDVLEIVNSYCLKNGVSFLNVGYIEDIAVYGPFVIPGKTGCLFCQDVVADMGEGWSTLKDDLIQINKSYQAPSVGPINMVAGALASLDAIKYLGQFGEIQCLNRRVGLWTMPLELEFQNSQKNANCRHCNKVGYESQK